MDFFRTRLSGLLNREVAEKQPMSEAALARQEILRALLRTPVRVGDDEYEALLAKVYEMALALHRNAGVDGDAACSDRNAGLEGESDSPTNARHREPQSRCGWEAIGFQAAAPDREFRGAGMLGLHCLLYALERHPQVCQVLLKAPFPFAAASINMTLVAARLAGVVEPGSDDDAACDPLAGLGDAGSWPADTGRCGEKARRAAASVSASRCGHLLESSHEGFFELHCAALEALERARRDVNAGPMDFAGCAAAARDEVAVLLAHEPRDVQRLRRLVQAVPRRKSGFLCARLLPSSRATSVFRRQGRERKWFALSTGTLRWYDESDVHSHGDKRFGSATAAIALNPGAPAGALRLTAGMTVKFRCDSVAFSLVSAPEDGSGEQHPCLCLEACDKREMEQWCIALTEHVALASQASGTN